MTLRLILLSFSILLLTVGDCVARNVDTQQAVFDPSFRTLQVYADNNLYLPPVIELNGPGKITVSFDELSSQERYLRYSLTHCDADWKPSQLIDTDILDGWNEAKVEDVAYSQATLSPYINYRITLPNEDMSPKLSGNYLLRVYDESEPSETILQARFMVVEPTVDITADISPRTDIDYMDTHQQMELTVDTKSMTINDPYRDIKVRIGQNSRSDISVDPQQPLRIVGSKLQYLHNRNLIFDAGNEYRRFETVSTGFPGMGVDQISVNHNSDNDFYHFKLITDHPRAGKSYEYDRTQWGHFTVNADPEMAGLSFETDLRAEYAAVSFSLDFPYQPEADIYIEGDLTGRSYSPANKMTYNHSTGMYEATLLLKQGSYNYQYVMVAKNGGKFTPAPIEGDYYPTQNQYSIAVYFRPPGQRYDRLIGHSTVTVLN